MLRIDAAVDPLLLCSFSEAGFEDRDRDLLRLDAGPSDGAGLLACVREERGEEGRSGRSVLRSAIVKTAVLGYWRYKAAALLAEQIKAR